ncbi:MAG: N-acetylglucosamine kinase [Actinomycetota bacterium]
MTVVLGVEAGGSHCHALAAAADGRILGGGSNRDSGNWEDVGIAAASGALRACVREALDRAAVAPHTVAASVFALAGVDFAIDEDRLGGIPEGVGLGGPARLMNDAYAALRAGTPRGFGIVVAAGTGSIVAGRNEQGVEARSLGLGPTFGDSGSASEVSEAGVGAVAGAYLRRSPATALTELLRRRTGLSSVEEFLEGAARGRIDASLFAPDVVEAANAGDEAATAILRRAGESMGETAAFVVRRLRMEEAAFDLVLAGWLLRTGNAALLGSLQEAVHAVAPGAAPVVLDAPPVVGSALLALELAGSTPDPAVRAAMADAAREMIVGAPG